MHSLLRRALTRPSSVSSVSSLTRATFSTTTASHNSAPQGSSPSAPSETPILSASERKAQKMAENRRQLIATLLGKRPKKEVVQTPPPPQLSTTSALQLSLEQPGVLVDRHGNVYYNPIQAHMGELRNSIPEGFDWAKLDEYQHPRPGAFSYAARLPHNDAEDAVMRVHLMDLRYGDQPRDVHGVPTLEEIEKASSIEYGESGEVIEVAERKPVSSTGVVLKEKKVHQDGSSSGTGRRKTSVAAVQLRPGTGKVLVNNKPYEEYFAARALEFDDPIRGVFETCDVVGKYDIRAFIHGGGITGQIDALKLGIARALENYHPPNRIPLAAAGLLTRDSRMVERKKYGQAKARKKYQWVKR